MKDFIKREKNQFSKISPSFSFFLFVIAINILCISVADAETASDYYKDGNAYFEAGKYEDALVLYNKAINEDGHHVKSWVYKAATLEKLKRYSEALNAVNKALSIYAGYDKVLDGYDTAWLVRGIILFDMNNYSEALEAFDEALNVYDKGQFQNKNNVNAWIGKGNAFIGLKNYSEALEAYEKALILDGSNEFAWSGKGDALAALGRNTDALDAYNSALSIDPTLTSAKTGKNAITGIGSVQTIPPTPVQSVVPSTFQDTLPQTTDNKSEGSNVLMPILLIAGLILVVTVAIFIRNKRTPLSQYQPNPIGGKPSHHDVFISYSSKNKNVADAICNHLESRQIRCWIAPRDITSGQDFPEAIIDAINGSKVMVLILSADSNISPQVRRELTNAVSKNLIIIPFRIDNAPLSKAMEYLIAVPHWLDAMTPPLEQHIQELEDTIREFLKRKAGTVK